MKKKDIIIYLLLGVSLVMIAIALQLMFNGYNVSALIVALTGIGLTYAGDKLDKKETNKLKE